MLFKHTEARFIDIIRSMNAPEIAGFLISNCDVEFRPEPPLELPPGYYSRMGGSDLVYRSYTGTWTMVSHNKLFVEEKINWNLPTYTDDRDGTERNWWVHVLNLSANPVYNGIQIQCNDDGVRVK